MSHPSSHPKIVIIGAGSLFFGRKLIWAMNHLEGLTSGHLALVDTDPEHLEGMRRLAERSKAARGSAFAISASTDFREVLPGADFVILSFSRENARFRGIDVQVSARHGILMCSGDTIGPGGVFRALREADEIQRIAEAMEELCPEAWLINYINPSAVFGILLRRVAKVRHFALCDSLHLPYLHHQYMKMIGLPVERASEFQMRIAGVNHFTWLLESSFAGENVLPRIHDAIRSLGESENPDDKAKSVFNKRISARLADFFGAIPVCTAHTKEYLPYFQGYLPLYGGAKIPPLKLFEHEHREAITAEMWEEVNGFGNGTKPIEEFLSQGSSDHATDVIQAIWNDSGRHLFINLPNRGRVANLPDDAVLEMECVVHRSGPDPLPCPDMPLGLRALQMVIIDTHELTVEAILRKDRNLLLRALAVDPIVNSLDAAEKVMADLYEAQKDVLPGWVAPPNHSVQSPSGTDSIVDSVQQGQTREGW